MEIAREIYMPKGCKLPDNQSGEACRPAIRQKICEPMFDGSVGRMAFKQGR